MAAGLIYFGTHLTAARNDSVADDRARVATRVTAAQTVEAQSCDMVFTDQAKDNIEQVVGRAVSASADRIREGLGVSGSRAFVSISVGVDSAGRLVLEDVAAYPEPERGVDTRRIVEGSGLNLDGIRLAAPQEGTKCSFTVPVDIARRI
jgi:hypothetical protein